MVEYDKDQLWDALFKILSDEELRRGFEGGSKELVKVKFGWDKVVLDIEKIYLRLIQR